jgi:hypothetical protein
MASLVGGAMGNPYLEQQLAVQREIERQQRYFLEQAQLAQMNAIRPTPSAPAKAAKNKRPVLLLLAEKSA